MDKQNVRLLRTQRQDHEEEQEVISMEAYCVSESEILYEYLQEGKKTTIRMTHTQDRVLLRIFTSEYEAIIPLQLHQKTQGKYHFGKHILTFDFILQKIECKGVAISFEYDIVSKESVISNNTWQIEVI